MRSILIFLMVLAVAACAASGDSRESDRGAERAIYERHAGAQETWVRHSNIRSWWPVGFRSVVLEMNRSRHYLVELTGPCDLELSHSSSLSVVGSRRNTLSEFDKIIVSGRACQIRSIRRLDYEAVKADLEAEGETATEKRGEVSVESEDQPSGGK